MTDSAHAWWSILVRALVLAGGIACATLLQRVVEWQDEKPLATWLGLSAAIAAITLGLVYVALRLPWPTLKRCLLELVAVGAALVLAETAIAVYRPAPNDRLGERLQAARRLGTDFDARSRSQVVAAMRREGIDAYPGTGSEWALVPTVRRRLPPDLYPLSHVGLATVVECNEEGSYLTYTTDELGFNNPAGLVAGGDIDVALVGESYALGHCLPAPYSLPGRIRGRIPRTANFGMAGTNVLVELAIFREFVEPLRPRIIVWTVNPLFVTAGSELRHPVLRRYLEPGFSQGLIGRQPEIDRLIREISIPAQAEQDELEARRVREAKRDRILGAWRLPETRAQLRHLVRAGDARHRRTDLGAFRAALSLAQQAAGAWGGELVVVLLPIYAEVVANEIEPDRRHDNLARVVGEFGITVVDGVKVFRRTADPAGLFTMRINNHPNAEGYALLAGEVLDAIRARDPGTRARASEDAR